MRIRQYESAAERKRQELVTVALNRWADWLMTFYSIAPRKALCKIVEDIDNKHENPNARMPRATGAHGDPVLAQLIADERAGHSWPASVHALIWDMPKTHRLALLGSALGMSQETIGKACGVRQQHVSVLLDVGRRTLAIELMIIEHVRRGERQASKAPEFA